MINKSSININEIFCSIQGEGKYLGYPQLFIRLAQCNFDCPFCDTVKNIPQEINFDKKISGYKNPIDLFELKAIIDENYSNELKFIHSISFTGGEPLLQKNNLKELALLFKKDNNRIFLETSGFLCDELLEIGSLFDIISIDLKNHNDKAIKNIPKLLKVCDKLILSDIYLKLPLQFDSDIRIIKTLLEEVAKSRFKELFIQPIDNKVSKDLIWEILEQGSLYGLDIRMSAQVHKLWGFL